MNDSKDFQDAESIRSRNSHVSSRPVSFPPHPIPGGMLSRSIGMPSHREWPPSIWDTWYIGKRFLQIQMHLHQLLILKNWIHGGQPLRSRVICLQRRKVKDQNKIEIWDASLDRQPKIQSSSVEVTLQKNYGPDQQRLQISDLHFDKFPTPATFACWKIRFKTEVCTCSQFRAEAMHWIKEVEVVDSVDD